LFHHTTAAADPAGLNFTAPTTYYNNVDALNFTYFSVDSLNFTTFSNINYCRNESAPHEHEAYEEFYETAQFITGLILYPVICIPGLLGNLLTLIVLSDRSMRTSTNAFLSALAVADTIKLLNDLLYFCTILLLRTDDVIGNRAFGYLYPYAHYFFSMPMCVSSWLTVSVAVERYIMVCHPTRARAVCNRTRAVLVCVAVFVVMTTLALPSALR
jgi:nociceptin receptor